MLVQIMEDKREEKLRLLIEIKSEISTIRCVYSGKCLMQWEVWADCCGDNSLAGLISRMDEGI